MRSLLPLPLLVGACTAQFVFFGGNQFGAPQRFQPSFQQQRFQPQPFQPQPFQSQISFQDPREGRFSSTFFRGNAATLPEPTKAPAAAPVAAAATVPAAAPAAPAAAPRGNYQWEGKSYLLTWRTRQNSFAWQDGVQFCRSQGMRLISLDSPQKADHFLALVRSDNAPYFWAGGELSFDSRTLSWQNGAVEEVRRGQHPWSFTGRTGPQPDGGERCLAILNNTYRDGVKFHDVGCDHRKPVVCEE